MRRRKEEEEKSGGCGGCKKERRFGERRRAEGGGPRQGPHRAFRAVVRLRVVKEDQILDEDGDSPQDEGHKEVHVDVVPRAVQLPV